MNFFLRLLNENKIAENFNILLKEVSHLEEKKDYLSTDFVKNNLIKRIKDISIKVTDIYINSNLFKTKPFDEKKLIEISDFFLIINLKLLSDTTPKDEKKNLLKVFLS